MNIIPAELNITIEQGSSYALELIWKDENGVPRDLSDWSAQLMARAKIKSTTAFINLSSTSEQPALNGIILGSDGAITVNMSKAAVNAISVFNGVYDLILTDSYGEATKLLRGLVSVKKRITR